MGIYDALMVFSWVVVLITLCAAASVLMDADWRDIWMRLTDAPSDARVCRKPQHSDPLHLMYPHGLPRTGSRCESARMGQLGR